MEEEKRDQDANSGVASRIERPDGCKDYFHGSGFSVYIPELCRYIKLDAHVWMKENGKYLSFKAYNVRLAEEPDRPVNIDSGLRIWKKMQRDGCHIEQDIRGLKNFGSTAENRIGLDWLEQEGFIVYLDAKRRRFRQKPGLQPGIHPPGYQTPTPLSVVSSAPPQAPSVPKGRKSWRK